jgi:hypothetical protein
MIFLSLELEGTAISSVVISLFARAIVLIPKAFIIGPGQALLGH